MIKGENLWTNYSKMGRLHKQKNGKNPVGRPWFDGKDENSVVTKLEQVFAIDGTIEEACSYAEISREAFYRYSERYPEFRSKIDDLRQKPVLKARQTAVQALSDPHYAFKYLEKKRRKEFGDSIDVTSGGKPIPILENVSANDSPKENTEIKE